MQSNNVNSWQEKTYSIFKQFITPINLPQQSEELRRVRALLGFALATSLLACLVTIIRYLAGESIFIETILIVTSFILYLVGKQGFYTPVVYFMIVGSAFFAPLIYFISPNNYYQSLSYYAAFSSILLAILLANKRTIPQTITINWVVVLFLLAQQPNLTLVERFSQFIPFAFGSIIIVIIAIVIERNFKQLNLEIYELNKRQNQFRYLFDTFPKPIIIHVNNKIIYSNASAERLLQNRNLSECLISDFIATDDIQNSQVDNQYGSMIVNYDTHLRLANEQTIPLKVTTQVVSYQKHLAALMLLQALDSQSEDNNLIETIVTELNKPLIVFNTSFEPLPSILFANKAFCEMVGYQDHKLLNHRSNILQNTLNGYSSIVDEMKLALDVGRDTISTELMQYRKDSTGLLTKWDVQIIYDEQGQGQYCIASVANLSELKGSQYEEHIVQQAVVSELGLLSLSIENHFQLLEHAAIMCEQVLEIDNCAIFEYQPQNQCLTCVAISHSDNEFKIYQQISLEPSSSQVAFALEKNEAITTTDFHTETRFENFSQYNSALSVIIPGHERAYGVLTVFNENIKLNIEDNLYFLQAIANVLGSFAESSQAHKAEQEQREFAEALQNATTIINTRLELSEILDKLMGYVLQVVPQVESGSIMLWDISEQSYRFIYTWGFEEDANEVVRERSFAADEFPLMQKMMGDHRPMILENVDDEPLWVRTNEIERIRSYLGAPIIVQGDCIGFFHLNSTVLKAFNQYDALRLQTFADKVGTAILNTRYAHELEDLVKERTEELQRERERFSSILETSGEGIFYIEGYKIKFANQVAASLLGYSVEELIGRDTRSLRPDDITEEEKQKLQHIAEELEVGQFQRSEIRLQRKDGTIFYAALTNSGMANPLGGELHMVTVMRDISQEKALDIAKSRFIANAAHELRSPITSLTTRMYMINKQPQKTDYHISRLEQIVGRMNRLVSDLLDMSYFEHGQVTLRPESIILQDVVDHIIGILDAEAELEKLQLIREMPEMPIHIWADVHRIEQVLTNLIVNAIHYTPKGGKVTVTCVEDTAEQVATICVSDTGEGIPPEHLENIFEAFYRLDKNMEKKGTGLGLSITREIVKLHQGTIHVESEQGKGTCFIVTLPLLEE